mmetsp:Transcript_19754/g.27563  ORF Transcript_19754/g.27563 Transcript_19754/m.27563 type:complete len:396 (-) Transcript_19754:116-1303(-)|eukprot:CAMPEP_0168556732 /NCGR_PEP_ID=MMETSP0413-20121227/9041_1 /TAXON_ID=136452 /ORGANISM="Filamoeba nolandi, Strain NC-AS-23-1" /LENGTH=395 /DNA_ID=CAMNT_0008587701 /DNA_START=169 /DNA_END=1356 /DNA_ORIENTATION=+
MVAFYIIGALIVGSVIYFVKGVLSQKPLHEISDFLGKRFTDPKVATQKTGKRYLVTGGSGFLGSHIVEALLERGEPNITAFDIRPSPLFANDPRVKFIQGDLRKKEDLLKACQGIDTVFHAAALVNYTARYKFNYKPSYDINYLGTKLLAEACVEQGVKEFLHVSSGGVTFSYDRPVIYNAAEDLPYPQPPYLSHYVETKILAEKAALEANGKGSLKAAAVRPGGGIFGPRETFLTGLFAEGHPNTVYGIGKPESVQEYTFVRNVVHSLFCLEKAIQTNPRVPGEAFFIGNDEEITYMKFNQLCAKHFRCKFELVPYAISITLGYLADWALWLSSGGIKGKLMELSPVSVFLARATFFYDISKAKRELGYAPVHSIEEGIRLTAEYYGIAEKKTN